MLPLPERLGVPPGVQAFFGLDELSFAYGDGKDKEVFDDGFHYVPTTPGIWCRGSPTAVNVMITHSAMEAIAFCSCHWADQPPSHTAFIALGNLPTSPQFSRVMQLFPNHRFILLFPQDLQGSLMDIHVAAGLRKIGLRMARSGDLIGITCRDRDLFFEPERLTLHAFQKQFGIRTRCRTLKPKGSATFLNQLTG